MSVIIDGTNGISDVDGSASTPAIRGTDANTGIFFPAADTIAFAEGGAEAMRIDSSGLVGIGTSSPSSYNSTGNQLVVGSGSGNQGMTISAGASSTASLFFAKGTAGSDPVKAFINKWTEGIEQGTAEYKLAVNNAKKELAKAAEERAITNVLSYVDNPLIRSQISFSLRNFARFYRAQEDFYRRLSRLAKYNPEAFQKAALTFDGIDHNGWIQKDDQGNPYFVYPHFAPGYRAMQGVLQFMGIPQDFKVPFPVQFGGSVKMLTPSLNPDSILPTFSGPAAALSITMLANVIDLPFQGNGKTADTIVGMTLGKYAVDRPLIDRLMPAHVNRAISLMSQDERDSQYASAYRKAVTYLEASGNGIPKKYDELDVEQEDMDDFIQYLKSYSQSLDEAELPPAKGIPIMVFGSWS